MQISIILKIGIPEPTYSQEGKLFSNINKRLTTEQLQSQISPQLFHWNPTEDNKGMQKGGKKKEPWLWSFYYA